MKKLITILAITSLFSFQAFAQLASDACNTPDSTCQAFQLGSSAQVLQDFSVNVSVPPSIGKARPGESVVVNTETNGDRGKRVGYINLISNQYGLDILVTCNPELSIVHFGDGVQNYIRECNITDDFGSSGYGQLFTETLGTNQFRIEFEIYVPLAADVGATQGVIHIEFKYL